MSETTIFRRPDLSLFQNKVFYANALVDNLNMNLTSVA
jgi:hypothetical protein